MRILCCLLRRIFVMSFCPFFFHTSTLELFSFIDMAQSKSYKVFFEYICKQSHKIRNIHIVSMWPI